MNNFSSDLEAQLLQLYAHLAKEAARFQIYALRAQKDNRSDLVQLYQALAVSHSAQANRLLLQVRGTVASSERNTARIIDQELPALLHRYEKVAEMAKKRANSALMTGSAHGSRINRLLTQMVKKHLDPQPVSNYYICDFCGFIATEEVPERCPICTAAPYRFIEVEQ